MVEEIAVPYGIGVISSGGSSSVTGTHDMAQKLGKFECVEVLQIGDHDQSGTHIFSLKEDVQAPTLGLGVKVPEFIRASRNPSTDRSLQSPQSPAKATDDRSFQGLTTQVESLPPRCAGRYSPLGDYRTGLIRRLTMPYWPGKRPLRPSCARVLLVALHRIR